MTESAITVVVATRNRAPRLAAFVGALERQDIGVPFDVVFVDDASTDNTWDELARVQRESSLSIKTVRREMSGGPGGARNSGWRVAQGELIAFTDDDCEPQPGWLAAVYTHLRDADLVQGRTLPNPAQWSRHGAFGRTVTETAEGLYPTCNMGYRRAVLEGLDGFDEHYARTCEDTDLAYRAKEAGFVSAWAPEALVYHDVVPSGYRGHLHEKLRWDGVALVVHDHPVLRAKLHRRLFWKRSHPPALAAAAGIVTGAVALARRQPALALAAVAAGAAPYARYRLAQNPMRVAMPRRVTLAPAMLVADWLEIGVMVAASVRHRTVVL